MPKDKDKKDRGEAAPDPAELTDTVLSDVVRLACLDPKTLEMPLLKESLKTILEHFKVLSQVHLEGLEPAVQINPVRMPLREDEVEESMPAEKALANAQHREGNFFVVPRVLGGEVVEEA